MTKPVPILSSARSWLKWSTAVSMSRRRGKGSKQIHLERELLNRQPVVGQPQDILEV